MRTQESEKESMITSHTIPELENAIGRFFGQVMTARLQGGWAPKLHGNVLAMRYHRQVCVLLNHRAARTAELQQ
jgi:hypothetical protein